MGIYEKLFKLRKNVGKVQKNAKNPFYKSKYFDINGLLEHIQPLLDEHELLLLQPQEGGFQKSILIDPESEESVEAAIELPHLNDPQDMGSAVTYYRRYTLQSLLGLQAEDDDGNRAASKGNDNKSWLNEGTEAWRRVTSAIQSGQAQPEDARKKYKVSKETMQKLQKLAK